MDPTRLRQSDLCVCVLLGGFSGADPSGPSGEAEWIAQRRQRGVDRFTQGGDVPIATERFLRLRFVQHRLALATTGPR